MTGRGRETMLHGKSLVVVGFVLAAWASSAIGQFPLAEEMSGQTVDAAHRADEQVLAPSPVPNATVESALFYLFGGALLVSAIGVCVCKSVVRMATWLFGALGAAAVLYFLMGATFLGAIQLIVYAGGTLILIIFGVMLTSKSPWVRFECRRIEFWAAGGVVGVLFCALITLLVGTDWPTPAVAPQPVTIAMFGEALLTTYLVPFEVASVLLLVVMIGAAYLARQERS